MAKKDQKDTWSKRGKAIARGAKVQAERNRAKIDADSKRHEERAARLAAAVKAAEDQRAAELAGE